MANESSFLIDMTCPVLSHSMLRFRNALAAASHADELGRYADAGEHYEEAADAAIEFACAVRDHMDA